MKRIYKKPMLHKESFELESQIAGCAIVNKNPSLLKQCNYKIPDLGFYVFGEGWNDCINYQYSEDNAIYCYHAGVNNLFGS